MKFSVLLSIYHAESVTNFNRAMASIWDEQRSKPNEIILIKDGPLAIELDECIDTWEKKIEPILKIYVIDKNIGLGGALNLGLIYCTNELVARMDTDDIAHPDRFMKQLDAFRYSDIDICSSWVSEFDDFENNIISYRKIPEKSHEINIFSKKKNPINHPAVMYKKSAVLEAGSYLEMMNFEDYYLWGRMLKNNAVFYNIQEPLVNMRSGTKQLERRRGISYAWSEIKFQKAFLSIGFINYFEFIRNISIRLTVRLAPKIFVKLIYKVIRSPHEKM